MRREKDHLVRRDLLQSTHRHLLTESGRRPVSDHCRGAYICMFDDLISGGRSASKLPTPVQFARILLCRCAWPWFMCLRLRLRLRLRSGGGHTTELLADDQLATNDADAD